MRTLRTRTVGILGALVVLIWAGAASASTISMVWISASGGAGVGSSTLTGVNIGDTAVLEIRVTVGSPTTGISGIGVRAQYSPAVVTSLGQTTCPPSGNNFFGPGSCGAFGFNIGGGAGFLPVLTTSLNSGLLGPPLGAHTGALVATGTPGAGQGNGATWVLSRITFSATGAGTTGNFFFAPGLDGQVPIGGGFSFPAATGFSISVIPEPGTFAMLALGLGALAFAGRRR